VWDDDDDDDDNDNNPLCGTVLLICTSQLKRRQTLLSSCSVAELLSSPAELCLGYTHRSSAGEVADSLRRSAQKLPLCLDTTETTGLILLLFIDATSTAGVTQLRMRWKDDREC
jgi:hypothetical protein